MKTTLRITMDKKLRDEAKKVAKSMGVPFVVVVSALLKRFVRDGMDVFEGECPFPSHTPNAETRKAIREMHKGGGMTARTPDEMFRKILGKNWRSLRPRSLAPRS